MSSSAPQVPAHGRVGTAYGDALRAGRDDFNARFAEARRLRPGIDAGDFLALLRGPADAVIGAVAAVDASRVRETADAVYDAALTLVGEKLAGPGGRYPVIDEMWRRLLPAVATLTANQPACVIAAMTNGLFNLCTTSGARPHAWLDSMLAAAPSLPAVSDLLRAGQLAAWRAGMAHFREGALLAGDALPGPVASGILGAPKLDWHAMRERLSHDRWWDPGMPDGKAGPRVVAVAGSFRGFGGLFPEPPRVASVDGSLVVSSGGACWHLTADVFGATFHRLDAAVLAESRESAPRFQGRGVEIGSLSFAVPGIGEITSAAQGAGTIAVTGALTHAVTLIAVA